jgi:hypothetical protein
LAGGSDALSKKLLHAGTYHIMRACKTEHCR